MNTRIVSQMGMLILLIPMMLWAEGWNSTQVPGISVNPDSTASCLGVDADLDVYSSYSGNHLLLADADGIRYFKLNSNGTVLDSVQFDSVGRFPNMVGIEDTLFAVYYSNRYIKVKKSTNAGVSWTTYSTNIYTSDCTGVDAVVASANLLHIVYGKSWYSVYRTLRGSSWSGNAYPILSTGRPHLALSDSRLHLSANTDYGEISCTAGNTKIRDKNLSTGVWQTQQTVTTGDSTTGEYPLAIDSTLHLFYWVDTGAHQNLYQTSRNTNGSTWSSPSQISDFDLIQGPSLEGFDFSSDEKLHVIGGSGSGAGLIEKHYADSSWSSAFVIDSTNTKYWFTLDAQSNDLYTFWIAIDSSNMSVRYRQYDANPLTPQNFTLGTSGNHPVLSWDKSEEADLDGYQIFRKVDTGAWNKYTTVGRGVTSYTDNSLVVGGKFDSRAYYYIKAIDMQENISLATVTRSISVIGGISKGVSEENETQLPTEFTLGNAFPNPFNPSTNLSYSLPSNSMISWSVYNLKGEQLLVTRTEAREAGTYSWTWNPSSAFPSGVYLIRLVAIGTSADTNSMNKEFYSKTIKVSLIR